MRNLKSACFLLCLFLPLASPAVEFKKDNPDVKYQVVNGIPVVTMGNASFSVFEYRPETEYSEPTNNYDESDKRLVSLRKKLILGDSVTEEEAVKVLTVYYQNVAFDPDSVVIKNMKLGEHKVYTWCSVRLFRKCSSFYGAAGSRIEYDLNGKNREGGMTGFKQVLVFLRKFVEPVETISP